MVVGQGPWQRSHVVEDGVVNLQECIEDSLLFVAQIVQLDAGSRARVVPLGITGYGKVDKKKISGDIHDPKFNGAVLVKTRSLRGRFDLPGALTATGGLLIAAIGIDLMGIKRLPVGNLLPGVFIAALMAYFLG